MPVMEDKGAEITRCHPKWNVVRTPHNVVVPVTALPVWFACEIGRHTYKLLYRVRWKWLCVADRWRRGQLAVLEERQIVEVQRACVCCCTVADYARRGEGVREMRLLKRTLLDTLRPSIRLLRPLSVSNRHQFSASRKRVLFSRI